MADRLSDNVQFQICITEKLKAFWDNIKVLKLNSNGRKFCVIYLRLCISINLNSSILIVFKNCLREILCIT